MRKEPKEVHVRMWKSPFGPVVINARLEITEEDAKRLVERADTTNEVCTAFEQALRKRFLGDLE